MSGGLLSKRASSSLQAVSSFSGSSSSGHTGVRDPAPSTLAVSCGGVSSAEAVFCSQVCRPGVIFLHALSVEGEIPVASSGCLVSRPSCRPIYTNLRHFKFCGGSFSGHP